jgi:hypothetical protein
MVTFLLLAPIALATVPAPACSAPAPVAASVQEDAGQADGAQEPAESGAGGPAWYGELPTIDGEPISAVELQRFLSLGVGKNQTNEALFGRIVEIELGMRKERGDDLSQYEVSEEEIEKRFAREIDDFKLKYPTLDPDTEIGRAFLSVDLYKEQLASAMVFDKLFFDENPDNWPDLTIQLITMEYGDSWVQDARDSYERRKAAAVEHNLDYIPPDDPIFVEALRSVILEGLRDFYIIETDPTVLPPGVLMTVEGLEVPIDEVFLRIQPYLTEEHLSEAKRWLVIKSLLEDYLANFELSPEQGGGSALVTQAEFREEFPEDGHNWYQEILQYDLMALQVMGYPSVEAYADYLRLAESFGRTVKLETDDDEILRASLADTNRITGAAKVDCEVILISAFDFENSVWKDGGWEWAKKRAAEVKKSLDEGADWNDVLEHESEFWDPPIPDVGHSPQFGRAFKGKFPQPQTRNQLMNLLGESEFKRLIWGPTVTDQIFYEQKRGTVAGPFKGPHGYYISLLRGGTPPVAPLNLNEPVHRDIAVEYYVRNALNAKVQELLAAALEEGTVTGIERW